MRGLFTVLYVFSEHVFKEIIWCLSKAEGICSKQSMFWDFKNFANFLNFPFYFFTSLTVFSISATLSELLDSWEKKKKRDEPELVLTIVCTLGEALYRVFYFQAI